MQSTVPAQAPHIYPMASRRPQELQLLSSYTHLETSPTVPRTAPLTISMWHCHHQCAALPLALPESCSRLQQPPLQIVASYFAGGDKTEHTGKKRHIPTCTRSWELCQQVVQAALRCAVLQQVYFISVYRHRISYYFYMLMLSKAFYTIRKELQGL